MVSIVKITQPMFPEVYEAMLRDWRPDLSADQWGLAFDGRWATDEDYCGYALTDGPKIVGVLGMAFSRRDVNGLPERFCNLHNWRVKDEYRARSLALMMPVRQLTNYTVTDFTASEAVADINRRLGFATLPSDMLMLPPCPSLSRGSNVEIRELFGSDASQADCLSDGDRQILADHQGIGCGHLLATNEAEYCYVVYSRIASHRLSHCLIHYVSNPRLFAAEHGPIRRRLLRSARSAFVVAEKRHFAGARLPFSFSASAPPRFFRSTTVPPRNIDTLYSEVALYKHSLLPGVKRRIRQLLGRCWPVRSPGNSISPAASATQLTPRPCRPRDRVVVAEGTTVPGPDRGDRGPGV